MIINFKELGISGGGSGSGVTPQQVEEQIDSALTPYWDSAATKDYVDEAVSGIDLSNYWTSAETQSAITEAYDSATTQIMDLSGGTESLKEDFAFISGRVQTNEEVLALAVNNIEGIKGDLSAYTPTSGFSTINGSAITNGGNLVVETDLSNYTPTTGFATVNGSAITNGGNLVIEGGAGDMDKLLPISGLPVSAEVGTVVSSPSVSLGKWTRSQSGATYTYYIKDLSGETLSSATIAEFYIPGVQNPVQINIQYRNSAWYWDDKQIVYTGEHYQIANWEEEGTTYYLQTIFPVGDKSLKFNFASSAKKDLATMATFFDPKGGSYKLFNYNGSEWEDILSAYTPTSGFATVNGSAITNGGNLVVEATLPVATEQTLGGVKVGDYNYGFPIFIQSNGMLDIATDRLSISEAETSNQTKEVLVNREVDRNEPWAYDPGEVFNIPFFSLSASVSFKSSELAEHYGDVSDNELFGTTYAPNQEEPHLYLYYNKEEEQDPYFTFNDLEQTGELPRFDLVDGTSAFTFAVTGEDGNEYTYTANVTVANGDDVSVVITIRNDSEDKDAGVDIWSDEIEMGAPITLNGSPDIALAKFGREFDPDLGDAVQKWSKYYNEDNINEVTDNLVKNEGGVSGIWKGTQAQYDTLTQSGATANPNTFYIIIPSA